MDEPKDFPHRKQGCHLVLRRKKVRLKALENIFLKFYVGIKKKLTMDFVSITPLTFFKRIFAIENMIIRVVKPIRSFIPQ